MDAKGVVRDYIEAVWNKGDMQAHIELTEPSYSYHLGGQAPRDRKGLAQFIAATRIAFPDWRVSIESLVGEGSLVAARWRGEVTHLGPFHGLSATGKKVTVTGINIYRLADGKIAEEWEETDSLGLLGQLGALPGG